jgi:anaerobic ribonucleoside-triphosphate reductase activating protein
MGALGLRINYFLPGSYANGPGKRAVIWVQGCTLGCPGCFNPETHAPDGGELVPVGDLFERVSALSDAIEGVSISGGEPLQQPEALLVLLQRIREETGLSVLVFSGYSWEEIKGMPIARPFLACVDVLIAGRYEALQPIRDGLLSSANQTLHLLTDRYTLDDVQAVPPAEVLITPEGSVLVSGVDPVTW